MSYGIKKSLARLGGDGRTRVYAASGINPGHGGRWHSRPITPNGETLVPVGDEIVATKKTAKVARLSLRSEIVLARRLDATVGERKNPNTKSSEFKR